MIANYLILFVISGATVVSIAILTDIGFEKIAGYLVFAPIVSLYSYLFINFENGEKVLQSVVLNTIYATPAIILFVITLFFLLNYLNGNLSILISAFIWLSSIIAVNLFVK